MIEMTNGIILINKKSGCTSRDVVNIVSKKLNTKKVGHTGTLDPMATGLLVICVGTATKLCEVLTSDTKEYIATMTFGIKTDTLDTEGKILKDYDAIIDKDSIIKVFNEFKKTYKQEVPIYSAVKVNGKKLYEYAREGTSVSLPKKDVTIYDINMLSYEIINNKTVVKFKCLVSKGTYIRSLINDIASCLNNDAIMSGLNRTMQGNFKLEDANEIDSDYKIINIMDVLKDYYVVNLDKNLEKKVINGCLIDNIYNKDKVLFKNDNNIFLYKDEAGVLKPFKMFL